MNKNLKKLKRSKYLTNYYNGEESNHYAYEIIAQKGDMNQESSVLRSTNFLHLQMTQNTSIKFLKKYITLLLDTYI